MSGLDLMLNLSLFSAKFPPMPFDQLRRDRDHDYIREWRKYGTKQRRAYLPGAPHRHCIPDHQVIFAPFSQRFNLFRFGRDEGFAHFFTLGNRFAISPPTDGAFRIAL